MPFKTNTNDKNAVKSSYFETNSYVFFVVVVVDLLYQFVLKKEIKMSRVDDEQTKIFTSKLFFYFIAKISIQTEPMWAFKSHLFSSGLQNQTFLPHLPTRSKRTKTLRLQFNKDI